MNKSYPSDVDWNKVPGVGTSNQKKAWGEILIGLWYFYMFLCLTFFLSIIADIVDGTGEYLESIQFWILFFIPCIVYLVIKAFKLFGNKA